MTPSFLNDDFLLDTKEAQRLYHEVAAKLPIVDFHNHLDPKAISQDHHWASIGENWLEGDHYKWRVMRWNGIPEDRVSGSASFREKYDAFAETIPHCIGNPMYHWTHLELNRYFGWTGIFGPETADEVWELTHGLLQQPTHGARGLLEQMNVQFVGTTDDPCDDLEHHTAFAADPSATFKMAPSFRPDRFWLISHPNFAQTCETLGQKTKTEITTFSRLISALHMRLDHFVAKGCKASDHGLNDLPPFSLRSDQELTAILQNALTGKAIAAQDEADFKAAVLIALGEAYAERNIVMQYHIGVFRNQNTKLFQSIGPDAGADSIADVHIGRALNQILDTINQRSGLPRTILYCLNPALNEVMVTIAGNFQDGSEPGKIQSGPAWWFNDQLDGMERHLKQVAQMGLLSRFIGMLTDSRSFLSFPRHEYYRRLVCQMIGRWVTDGSAPSDPHFTDQLIRRLCYENARDWFLDTRGG